MRAELSIPGFKKKMLVNTFYAGQTMYIVLCIAFRGKVAISWPSIPCPVTKIHQLSRPGCFAFLCSDLPIHNPPFDLSGPIFTINPFHLIVDFEAFWELSF